MCETGRRDDEEDSVTEAMIDAGVSVFHSYDPRFEEPDGIVRRIWRAMNAARKPIPATPAPLGNEAAARPDLSEER